MRVPKDSGRFTKVIVQRLGEGCEVSVDKHRAKWRVDLLNFQLPGIKQGGWDEPFPIPLAIPDPLERRDFGFFLGKLDPDQRVAACALVLVERLVRNPNASV